MVSAWLTVLIALIAPAFALGGVVVGALLQRRTTREQIEAQREKDRETWRREDQYRFVAEKRELYGEILAHYKFAERQARQLKEQLEGRIAGLIRDEQYDRRTALAYIEESTPEQAEATETLRQSIELISKAELFASSSVRNSVRMTLISISLVVVSINKSNVSWDDGFNKSRTYHEELLASMRADLGAVDEPTESVENES